MNKKELTSTQLCKVESKLRSLYMNNMKKNLFPIVFSIATLLISGNCSANTAMRSFEMTHSHSNSSSNEKYACFNSCQLGVAGFSTMNPADWYVINTVGYPVTVPLSLNRNRGSTQGDIHLTSRGLKIKKRGNYFATFTAVLLNNDPNAMPLIPLFLVPNDTFDPASTTTIGTIVALPPGIITSIESSGILQNVKPGTKFSIVATNAGSPDPQPITVVAWDISLFKIPCESKKRH